MPFASGKFAEVLYPRPCVGLVSLTLRMTSKGLADQIVARDIRYPCSAPFAVTLPGLMTIPILKEVDMSTNLYVGGLPYSVAEQQLQELFSAHGTVASARVITDKFTGQSRGFGFVEMSSQEEAQRAIQALNGTQLGGRTLTVNEARPQEKRANSRPGGGGGRDRW
jgi:RNA recognition motif. (a.k.a. RRM, RBD, or RNP domain)